MSGVRLVLVADLRPGDEISGYGIVRDTGPAPRLSQTLVVFTDESDVQQQQTWPSQAKVPVVDKVRRKWRRVVTFTADNPEALATSVDDLAERWFPALAAQRWGVEAGPIEVVL